MPTQLNKTTYSAEIKSYLQSNPLQTEADILLACHLALQLDKEDLEAVIPSFQECAKKLSTYSYEIQLALATVFRQLNQAHYLPKWQSDELIPYVELAWLKTHLILAPKEAMIYPNKYLLSKAITNIEPKSKGNLSAILEAGLHDSNYSVQIAILSLVKYGIKTGLLTFEIFQKCCLHSLKSGHLEIVYQAADLIMSAPYTFKECPEVSIRLLLERKEEGLRELAIQLLAKWPQHPFLRRILQEKWSPSITEEIIKACAQNPQKEDIKYIIKAMKIHPFKGMGQLWQKYIKKGIPFNAKEQKYLIEQYLNEESIPLSVILNLQPKNEKILEIEDHTFNAAQQIKWIKLLSLHHAIEAPKILFNLLTQQAYRSHIGLILDALCQQEHREAESAILDLFTTYPKLCSQALKKLGGQESIDRMKGLLEFKKTIKKKVPTWEREAIELLLFLSNDHLSILQYIEKNRLPFQAHIIEKIGLREANPLAPFMAKVIQQNPPTDELRLRSAIRKLGEMGDTNHLSLLIQVLNHPEEELQALAWKEAHTIVRRAYQAETIIPLSLLSLTQDQAVKKLLSIVLLDAVQSETRSLHIQNFLSHLSEVVSMEVIEERIVPLLSHKDPHIIKFVLECLGNTRSTKVLNQLAQFIHPQQDIYTLRQALIGLTKIKDNGLEEQVIPLLYHRNMNIKKTAAAYLEKHATTRSLTDLLHWLKIHDNPGFRSSLNTALRNITGDQYSFLIINEIENSNSTKEQELLALAFHDKIGFKHIVNKAASFPKLCETTCYQEWKEATKQKANLESSLAFIKHYKSSIKELEAVTINSSVSVEDLKEIESIASSYRFNSLARQSLFPILREQLHESTEYWPIIIPLIAKWKPILNTAETRIVLSQNKADKWANQLFFLDVNTEELQLENMLDWKPENWQKQIFNHHLEQQPIANLLNHLIENDKSVLVAQLALKESNIQLHQLNKQLTAFYWGLEKINLANYHTVEKEVGNWILKTSPNPPAKLLANRWRKANVEGKINLLLSRKMDVSSFKKEIEQLYDSCNASQKKQLLSYFENELGFEDLILNSFKKYLDTQKSPYWGNKKLQSKQIQLLEKHPDRISIIEERKDNLSLYSDDFLKEVIQEADLWTEENQLSQRLKSLPVERVWNLIKQGVESKKWDLLYLLKDYQPVVEELAALLSKLNPSETEILFDWLLHFPKPIRFPELEQSLMEYIKSWANPALAWRLLFSLDVWESTQSTSLSNELIKIFAPSSNDAKTQMLEILVANPVKSLLNSDSFKQAIKEHSSNDIHQLLRLSALLEGTYWSDFKQAKIGVEHLIELNQFDPKKAIHHFNSMKEKMEELSLSDQAYLLEELYPQATFGKEITIHIAQILSTEVLFLDSLKDENKARFKKAINQLLLKNQLPQEIDQSQLLKNLFQEPNEPLINVIKKLLFDPHDKKARNLYLRLLKKALPKSEYLEINAEVLHFSDPPLLRQAIRILSYGNYYQATPNIIPLLYHAKKEVKEAAEAGLVHLGEKSLPMLIKAAAKARPDKRARIEGIIEVITPKDE